MVNGVRKCSCMFYFILLLDLFYFILLDMLLFSGLVFTEFAWTAEQDTAVNAHLSTEAKTAPLN